MLININPILNPELLYQLRAMGHGDKLVLTDANFPAYSHSINNKVIRLDGVNIYEAAKAILSVFPLDSFIDSAAERMQVDNCLLYTSPSPRDVEESRMPSSA